MQVEDREEAITNIFLTVRIVGKELVIGSVELAVIKTVKLLVADCHFATLSSDLGILQAFPNLLAES